MLHKQLGWVSGEGMHIPPSPTLKLDAMIVKSPETVLVAEKNRDGCFAASEAGLLDKLRWLKKPKLQMTGEDVEAATVENAPGRRLSSLRKRNVVRWKEQQRWSAVRKDCVTEGAVKGWDRV